MSATELCERRATEVAPELLGLILHAEPPPGAASDVVPTFGRIVEVEAYCGDGDEASHSAIGLRNKNATMFGPPGHLYVYLTYGVHWCSNVVCGPPGTGDAVLLRAVAPLGGAAEMEQRRSTTARPSSGRDLCSGPAKLTQAFAMTGADDGSPLELVSTNGASDATATTAGQSPPAGRAPRAGRSASRFTLIDDGFRASEGAVTVTTRVGISKSVEFPWRWYVTGDPNVSRR